MALSLTQDVTVEFNQDGFYIADASNWDYLIWQFVGPSTTIGIYATNDSGAIQGVTDGFALTSINYTSVQATDLSSGATVDSITGDGLYRVAQTGQFVKFGPNESSELPITADKVIIRYHKFS